MRKIFPLETYLHIFQLEGYQPIHFLKWFLKHALIRTSGQKKPLVWTWKAKMLYRTALLLCLLPFLLFGITIVGLFVFVLIVLFPILQLLGALVILKPYEIYNKAKTIRETREKIKRFKDKGLIVIGITGSFGKTSVKEFSYHILKSKYQVLRTPKSYNTIFGIAKVIDLELDESYKYFICEMGAYKKGEIQELCDMVLPDYGILTGIAEQHLNRFGSLQNIIEGKFELVQSLPENGIAILNGDNNYIIENKGKASVKTILYGLTNLEAEVRGKISKLTPGGSTFELTVGEKTKNQETKLIGKSNLQNILGAIALAHALGMSIGEVSGAIETLEPVPNRLQLTNKGEVMIINDAYNSNPEGFKEAVDTTSLFNGYRKIMITPGIVDLGKRNDEIHQQLGEYMAKVFDYIILVGDSARTASLKQGLKMANYSSNKIFLVKDLKEARVEMEKLIKGKTVVLFENDLPDNF